MHFKVYCLSGMNCYNYDAKNDSDYKVQYIFFAVGMYGDKRAKEYELNVTMAEVGGTILDREETEEQQAQQDYNVLLQGWFHFVQTEDGSIPIIRHSIEEDGEVINTKKAIVATFQANFMGTEQKEEADPQSMHTSHYTYVCWPKKCERL